MPGGWIDASANSGDVAENINPPVFRLDIGNQGGPLFLLNDVRVAVLSYAAAATISPATVRPSSSCRSHSTTLAP